MTHYWCTDGRCFIHKDGSTGCVLKETLTLMCTFKFCAEKMAVNTVGNCGWKLRTTYWVAGLQYIWHTLQRQMHIWETVVQNHKHWWSLQRCEGEKIMVRLVNIFLTSVWVHFVNINRTIQAKLKELCYIVGFLAGKSHCQSIQRYSVWLPLLYIMKHFCSVGSNLLDDPASLLKALKCLLRMKTM